MSTNILDQSPECNAEPEPKWIVLHNASGAQRRRWNHFQARLCDELVGLYGWVSWREGHDVHVKHRCLMSH